MTQRGSRAGGYVAALLLAAPGLAFAAGSIELGLGAGASYLPMDSWTDFFGGLSNSTYSEDPYGMCVEASAAYGLTPRHILRLSVERLVAEPSMHSISFPRDESGNPIGPASDVFTEWTISAIPVALTYEFRPI